MRRSVPLYRQGPTRSLTLELLDLRLAMIAEGSSYSLDAVIDTSAVLGSISAVAEWGDGTSTPLAVSTTPAVGPIKVRFDYTLDTGNFFNTAEKRDILQIAAEMVFSRFSDSLTAITPSGTNTWQAVLFNPATGGQVSIPNLNIAANELVVYVGARPLSVQTGGQTVALGGSGGSAANGTAAWVNSVVGRGQPGALTPVPTDTAPWGGSITVDPNVKWHFGPTTDGLDSDEYDFLSAVCHEFMHVLGFGITFRPFGNSSSWDRLVSNGQFIGNASMNANGGQAVPLDGDLVHWREGTQSVGQETLMDPTINGKGIRKLPTPLDLAGLVDIGWNMISQQTHVAGTQTYGDDGNFPVQVTLKGSRAGSRSTSIGNVSVTNVAPTLDARGNQTGQANVPINIVDLGVFQDVGFGSKETFQYDIDWGDGSPLVEGIATIDRAGSAGVTTLGSFDGSHTYSSNRIYTVRYRVADDNGGVASQMFTIQISPPPELRLALSRPSIRENEGTNAALLQIETIGFNNSQSIEIQLTSADVSEATVPSTVTIPAGVTLVTIGITAVDDTLLDGTQSVEFIARSNSIASLPISILVLDHETVTVALNINQTREDAGAGAAVLHVARSNTDHSSPLDVQLASSDPTAATLPPSVTIPAGANAIDVSVTAVDDSIVDGNQNTQLSASANGYEGSSTILSVQDYEPLQWVEQGITLAESSANESKSITIRLPVSAPSSGVTLNLTADIDGQLLFPSQVTIPGGQTTATVSVSAINDTLAESPKPIKIAASGSGYIAATIPILLTDDDRSIWTNFENVFDTNGDGFVDPTDVLQVINFLKRFGTGELPNARDPLGPPFVDVNGNGFIEPLDVLLIINFLNRRSPVIAAKL